MCVLSSHLFWTSYRLVDVPAGVTQEEGHTGFLHVPSSAVRALIFIARRIQPFLSLVDSEVEFCVLTNQIVLHLLGLFWKSPSSCDSTEIRTHVPTSECFEVTTGAIGQHYSVVQRKIRTRLDLLNISQSRGKKCQHVQVGS